MMRRQPGYFHELLHAWNIEPRDVCVMRHTPRERLVPRDELEQWVRKDRPMFEAYQRGQGPSAGSTLRKRRYLASFIGPEKGQAKFVGLYRQTRGPDQDSVAQHYRREENRMLIRLGMGTHYEDPYRLWFYLRRLREFEPWEFRLVIEWKRAPDMWWRKAEANKFRIIHAPQSNRLVHAGAQSRLSSAFLGDLEEFDRIRAVKSRKEQAFLREFVLAGRDHGQCYLCGGHFPVELLAAAHIKPRARCSHREKADLANVVPMCLLGCDAVFERRYVAVVGDRIQLCRAHFGARSHLKFMLKRLDGRCLHVGPQRRTYFEWHAMQALGASLISAT